MSFRSARESMVGTVREARVSKETDYREKETYLHVKRRLLCGRGGGP